MMRERGGEREQRLEADDLADALTTLRCGVRHWDFLAKLKAGHSLTKGDIADIELVGMDIKDALNALSRGGAAGEGSEG